MSFKKGDWVVMRTQKLVRGEDGKIVFPMKAELGDDYTYPMEVVGVNLPDPASESNTGVVHLQTDSAGDGLYDQPSYYKVGTRGMRLATKADFAPLIDSLKLEVRAKEAHLSSMISLAASYGEVVE